MVNYSRDEPILVSSFAGFLFVIDNVSAMLVLLAATLTTAVPDLLLLLLRHRGHVL